MPSSFIYVVANGKTSFFLMAELYSIVYIYFIFFIHSHEGCFYLLDIVNKTAMCMGVQYLFQMVISSPLAHT